MILGFRSEYYPPTAQAPEFKKISSQMVELRTFDNVQLKDVRDLLEQNHFVVHAQDMKDDEVMNHAATLVQAFIKGIQDEYQQQRAEGKKFKPASLRIDFSRDPNYRTAYSPSDHAVYLPMADVRYSVENLTTQLTKDPINQVIASEVDRYRLKGGEEAAHSIWIQENKLEGPVLYDEKTPIEEYTAQPHELDGLQRNIKQAEHNQMPRTTIESLKDLLQRTLSWRANNTANRKRH
jgi:hypothetical protein